MNRFFALIFFLTALTQYPLYGQEHSFPFGEISYRELEMTTYDKDTAAAAVVLNEFGDAFMDNENDHNLILQYHVRVKILKKEGLEQGTIEIPLFKQDSREERLRDIKAATFNLENNVIRQNDLVLKNVFTENRNRFINIKKFALPNVRVGSVIELQYELESPFYFNFRTWQFQSDIPKMKSEYWATIPANFIYNISLRGFLKLDHNESEIVRGCFTPNGHSADCARYKWRMSYVPAFIEEEYMTAKSNFLSAINFELSEFDSFDGRKDKITKEWKDAEDELRKQESFGIQIKRGKDIIDEHVEHVIAGEQDPLAKARKIYTFIREWYRWNDVYGKYSDLGIKKAFDSKTGNVGDINLSLVAALKYAGLAVEPLMLSTRENGLPTELHPVLSDFNYVIAKLTIDGKVYLLDATDDFVPFGLLPERCLNGKGRVLGEKESYWYELKPADRAKKLRMLTLRLDRDGYLRGTVQTTYIGYEAAEQRRKIYTFNSQKEYIDDLNKSLDRIEIKSFQLEHVDDFNRPLVEKLDVEISGYDNLQGNNFLFNPFLFERLERNPFRSNERLYPVDFGTPIEQTMILNLEYPEEFELIDPPSKIGLALPNSGGKYIFDVQGIGNHLVMNNSLIIGKTVFTSEEYHYLKELFNRVIQVQNTDLIFKRKG